MTIGFCATTALFLLLCHGTHSFLPTTTATYGLPHRSLLFFGATNSGGDSTESTTSTLTNEASTVCVLTASDESFFDEARQIADSLGLSISKHHQHRNQPAVESSSSNNNTFRHALRLVPYELGDNRSTFALAIEPILWDDCDEGGKQRRRKKKQPKTSPYFIDLCPPPNSRAGKRASGNSGKADLLVKAVAPRKGSDGEGAIVWDLTAGLGQDSLVLAKNGAKTVTMVEKNPIVAALLQDAMRRLELLAENTEGGNNVDDARALLETLRFSFGEGADVLTTRDSSDCDVVYLDPMFPPRQKQSAVKKGMSILHGLLETNEKQTKIEENERQIKEEELLQAALKAARLRVVVKRPAKAPVLGDGSTKPSHALTGSVNRWDIYVQPPLPTS